MTYCACLRARRQHFWNTAWAGATIGLGYSATESTYPDSLGSFAGLCGTAFQLQDDLLGLTADEAVLGKPVRSDIPEGKRTCWFTTRWKLATRSRT